MDAVIYKALRWGILHRDLGELLDSLSKHTMEVVSCIQDVSNHAASLLDNLNLQREHALFCDCVIGQRQNPAHLYPAHRCVLAASSPVFAALLPSTGALLELHHPFLSESVLELVLDYIYTGALPSLGGQQMTNSLMAAADYLQMNGLLEALRAGQPTAVNPDTEDLHTKSGHRLFSVGESVSSCCRTLRNALSKPNDPHTANAENCEEPSHRAHTNNISCIKKVNVNTPSSNTVGAIDSSSEPANKPCTGDTSHSAAINVISSVRRGGGGEQASSSMEREGSTVYHRSTRRCTEEEIKPQLLLTTRRWGEPRKNKMNQMRLMAEELRGSPVSLPVYTSNPADRSFPLHNKSLPPLPCGSSSGSCGAVPVICHSSGVMMPQASLLADSVRAATTCSRPASPEEIIYSYRSYKENANVAIPAPDKSQDGLQHQDWGHNSQGTARSPKVQNWIQDYDPDHHQREEEQGPLRSRPLQELENISDAENTELKTSSRSHHAYNIEGESYLGLLYYNCMTSEPADVREPHSHSPSEGRPIDASHSLLTAQSDKSRPSSNPNQSPEGWFHGREPGARLLFLDISSGSREKIQEPCDKPKSEAFVGERYTFRGESGVGDRFLREQHYKSVDLEKHWNDPLCKEARTQAGQEVEAALCGSGGREMAPSLEDISKMKGEARLRLGVPDCVPASPAVSMPMTLSVSTSSWMPGGTSAPELHLYQCSLCDRSFSQRGSLNRHLRSHLGVRPYPCPRCPMTFSRQYRVTEHMRVHERCMLREDLQKPSAPYI